MSGCGLCPHDADVAWPYSQKGAQCNAHTPTVQGIKTLILCVPYIFQSNFSGAGERPRILACAKAHASHTEMKLKVCCACVLCECVCAAPVMGCSQDSNRSRVSPLSYRTRHLCFGMVDSVNFEHNTLCNTCQSRARCAPVIMASSVKECKVGLSNNNILWRCCLVQLLVPLLQKRLVQALRVLFVGRSMPCFSGWWKHASNNICRLQPDSDAPRDCPPGCQSPA